MKIAFISDIHGNIHALEAVIEDINRQGVDSIMCNGDLVGYGPFPNEVISLVRNLKIPSVMGNYDDTIGNMKFICGCDYKDEKAMELGQKSIIWTQQNTSEASKEFLRNLSATLRIESGGKKLLAVHGSPLKINEYIFENVQDEYAKELLDSAETDILVCGHTHIPFSKKAGKGYIINAGSVGKPKHGKPDASYVILAINEEVRVEVRYVPYNYEAVARAIEEQGLPVEFAEMLRTGKG